MYTGLPMVFYTVATLGRLASSFRTEVYRRCLIFILCKPFFGCCQQEPLQIELLSKPDRIAGQWQRFFWVPEPTPVPDYVVPGMHESLIHRMIITAVLAGFGRDEQDGARASQV